MNFLVLIVTALSAMVMIFGAGDRDALPLLSKAAAHTQVEKMK